MGDIFSDYAGKWVFVKSGNDKYIGRCVEQISSDFKSVMLQPAFYYISEYVQDPNTGSIARQLMITPVELCIGFESAVRVNSVDMMLDFDNMSTEDKHQFEQAVRSGIDGMIEAKAAKSGITLETSMPSENSSQGGVLFGG